MYKIFALLLSVIILSSCNQPAPVAEEAHEEYEIFGDSIDDKNIQDFAELKSKLAETGKVDGKIFGIITEVCQKKGCWISLAVSTGDTLHVTFRDYSFFLPKDGAGRSVVMEGTLTNDTLTVDMLRHYAEDAGKTKEEIDAISEPIIKTAFEASGVLIKI
jgi:hypothetical protein